jgi:hypothetical protein
MAFQYQRALLLVALLCLVVLQVTGECNDEEKEPWIVRVSKLAFISDTSRHAQPFAHLSVGFITGSRPSAMSVFMGMVYLDPSVANLGSFQARPFGS